MVEKFKKEYVAPNNFETTFKKSFQLIKKGFRIVLKPFLFIPTEDNIQGEFVHQKIFLLMFQMIEYNLKHKSV